MNGAYVPDAAIQEKLGQYPTPVWAAQLLLERYFPHLTSDDLVIEPSCGPGSFLMALPDNIPAIGVELDPRTAAIARINTGRTILEGDFCTVDLPGRPTAIIGNPPFDLKTIDGFLARAHGLLEEGGQAGFILPCYAFQTADRVCRYSADWSLGQEMIPRNIYPGLSLPLMFARFTKEKTRVMIGFALYQETSDMLSLKKRYRDVLAGVGKSVWKATIAKALEALGGQANVEALYAEIEGKKPTKSKFWREQVRKVLRQAKDMFRPMGDGWYSFA